MTDEEKVKLIEVTVALNQGRFAGSRRRKLKSGYDLSKSTFRLFRVGNRYYVPYHEFLEAFLKRHPDCEEISI